jgi:hypothetical protein
MFSTFPLYCEHSVKIVVAKNKGFPLHTIVDNLNKEAKDAFQQDQSQDRIDQAVATTHQIGQKDPQ